jgi:uncharacterized membrane protein YeaQ/YmgE (transglycosylase-associated protein family)
MEILATITIGLVLGFIARILMPGRDPMGFILTALLGIVGAWLGSWAGSAMGLYRPGEPAGWLMSILGAMIVLFIYRLVVGGRSRPALR